MKASFAIPQDTDDPIVPDWLSNVPIERRQAASKLMQTAYAILLANHGQAARMAVRQAVDCTDLNFQLNLLRSFDHEESAQVKGRFAEAQLYMKQAMLALGLPNREAFQEGLRIVGKAEAIFDGIFDLIALHTVLDNLSKNKELALHVEQIFELVRRSDPALSREFGPLPKLDLDTGEKGLSKAADYLGIAVGSPRFWSWDKWAFVVGIPLAVVLLVLGMFAHSYFVARDVYRDATHIVKSHPVTARELGLPIATEWPDSIEQSGSEMSLDIPVSGPMGRGTVIVNAKKIGDTWVFTAVTLSIEKSKESFELGPGG